MDWIKQLRNIALLAAGLSAFWAAPQTAAADDCFDDGDCLTCLSDQCVTTVCSSGSAEIVC